MEIIDITGLTTEGMWEYGFPHGHFRILELDFDYLGHRYKHEGFEGFVGMTGTYIETDTAYRGYKNAKSIHEIPLKNLVNVDTFVLQIPYEDLSEKDGRKFIQISDVKKAEKEKITENSAILVSTGYSKNWNKENFIDKSPFFKKDSIYYLLDKKPVIIGSDFPSWENKFNPELHLKRLFNSNVILIFNCVNLEKIKNFKVKLIALPLKIKNISMSPCRAVIID